MAQLEEKIYEAVYQSRCRIEVNKTLFHPIQSHEANATLARIYP
jgi:hypothetical protein